MSDLPAAIIGAQVGGLALTVGVLAGRLCVAGIMTRDDLEALLAWTERSMNAVPDASSRVIVEAMRTAAETMVANAEARAATPPDGA